MKVGLRCNAGECGLCPEINRERPLKDYTHENFTVKFPVLTIRIWLSEMCIHVNDGGQDI